MPTPDAAVENYRLQQRIARLASIAIAALWNRMDAEFDTAFARILPGLTSVLTEAQTAAARTTAAYTSDILFQTRQIDLPVASVDASAFAGTAGDGRSLSGLLYGAVTASRTAVAGGADVDEALRQGGRWLTMATLTAIADTNREATSAQIGMRPAVGGYTRMLNAPSCSRCIALAGKWFRWNQGFRRHPRCDCRHVPASENIAGDLTTDPYAAFWAMSKAEQDHAFGTQNARAIRDGADLFRVVNVDQRGLATARAAAKYGTPSRLTIDDIYRQAGNRRNAIRMMTAEGYITGPQNAAGNVVGQFEGFGQLGKGGRARAASDAVASARATGIRDQLNRYTMTAAERRIYDVSVRAAEAERGYWVRSIGQNSADKHTLRSRITPEQRELVQLELQKQLADLPGQPAQVIDLARRVGLI